MHENDCYFRTVLPVTKHDNDTVYLVLNNYSLSSILFINISSKVSTYEKRNNVE